MAGEGRLALAGRGDTRRKETNICYARRFPTGFSFVRRLSPVLAQASPRPRLPPRAPLLKPRAGAEEPSAHPQSWALTISRPSLAPDTKNPPDLVPDPEVPKKLKLLWLACGNRDGLLRVSQGVHRYLKEKGVPHVWNVDGNAHDTPEWQNNFYHFAQRIFK